MCIGDASDDLGMHMKKAPDFSEALRGTSCLSELASIQSPVPEFLPDPAKPVDLRRLQAEPILQ